MKIGVIGLGSIGMRHARNLQELGHEVVGYDPIKERRDQFKGDSLGEAAYVVASPTSNHVGRILNSLIDQRPAFIEKPIAGEPVTDRDIRHVAMVGYNLRFHFCTKKAKEWIDAGKIGRPLWANFTCGQFNDRPEYLRDGVILNWSHEIDLALYLLGPATLEASSTRLTNGQDNLTIMLLTHESDCRSIIHLDYITQPEKRFFCIYGEKGEIFASLKDRYINIQGEHYESCYDKSGSYDQDYKDEMKAFVDRIEGKETLGCTGPEALKVLGICLEVRKQAGL